MLHGATSVLIYGHIHVLQTIGNSSILLQFRGTHPTQISISQYSATLGPDLCCIFRGDCMLSLELTLLAHEHTMYCFEVQDKLISELLAPYFD